MKKTLFLAIVLSYLMPIYATNSVVVNNVTIPQGGTGTISVALNNDKNYTAFSLKLTLPEGVTYTGVAKGARMAEDHSLSGNGTTGMITCLSTANTPFTGTSGELFTITVSVSNEALVGSSLDATLTEVTFSTTSAEDPLDDVIFNIIVGEPADTRTVLDETSTTAPVAATGVDVRVKRTIKANEWSTICLPFSMTEAQVKSAFGDDVQLADFNDYEFDDVEGTIIVKFNTATVIEANHPYIIKIGEAVTEFTVDGVDVDPQDAVVDFDTDKRHRYPRKMVGTYEAGTTLEWGTLFLSGNQFWYSVGSTKMKAFRAYFNFNDLLPDFEDNYESRNISMSFDDEVTGISIANVKDIDNRYYNLNGQRVESSNLRKGLYIKNGRKEVIK